MKDPRWPIAPVKWLVALLSPVVLIFALAPRTYPQSNPDLIVIAAGEPLVIGHWLVVKGLDSDLGIDSRRGIEIASDDKENKLFDHPIALIGEDSGCSPEGGARAATRLKANKRIVAAVGSSCSSEAFEGVKILFRARIVTVSPSNSAPFLTAPDRPIEYSWYLRVAHNDKVQGVVAAEYASGVLQVKKAATIHDESPYSTALASAFEQTFARLGGIITSQMAVQQADRDMRTVLTTIALSQPELIYIPVFVGSGSEIARQTKGVTGLEQVKLMGGDGMFASDLLPAAGQAAVGMYLTIPDVSVEALGPAYAAFLAKYHEKYGRPVSLFHAHAYDAATMIFAALEKVAQSDAAGNTSIGRQALRDALYATRDFKGVTGTLTCNPYGDCGDPKMAVYQVVSANPGSWKPGVNPKKVHSQSGRL